MRSKRWLALFLVLNACSDDAGSGGGGANPPVTPKPEPKLEAELGVREAQDVNCDLDGRVVKLTLPESGGRVSEYITRVLITNASLWPRLSEADGAMLYSKCLRPEIVARLK